MGECKTIICARVQDDTTENIKHGDALYGVDVNGNQVIMGRIDLALNSGSDVEVIATMNLDTVTNKDLFKQIQSGKIQRVRLTPQYTLRDHFMREIEPGFGRGLL